MRAFVLTLAALFLAGAAAQAEPTATVTIERVQLKNSSGAWVTVIEPDKIVDLSVDVQPGISFFNNGRVVPGEYDNFKVTLKGLDQGRPEARGEITARQDFIEPVSVGKSSYIGVWFTFTAVDRKLEIRSVNVTVGEITRVIPGERIEKTLWP